MKMYHIEQNLYIFSNVIGKILFERAPLNELLTRQLLIKILKIITSFRFGEINRTSGKTTLFILLYSQYMDQFVKRSRPYQAKPEHKQDLNRHQYHILFVCQPKI